MITLTDTQLLRLEAIRREARTLFERIEDLEEEAYKITGEADPCGHTTDLLYQSGVTVDELMERLNAVTDEEVT
jgi:hypothetical protein